MEGIKFLNLEYIILALRNVFYSVDVAELPSKTLEWVQFAQDMAIFVALIVLALLIYAKTRFSQMAHLREHKRELAIEKLEGKMHIKNERWLHVIELVGSANVNDWRQAIIEADVLLDKLLEELGLSGESLGEKLKSANRTHFTTLDLAWEAHKMRNDLAHGGSEVTLTQREARRTIDLFRQVFEEFEYI